MARVEAAPQWDKRYYFSSSRSRGHVVKVMIYGGANIDPEEGPNSRTYEVGVWVDEEAKGRALFNVTVWLRKLRGDFCSYFPVRMEGSNEYVYVDIRKYQEECVGVAGPSSRMVSVGRTRVLLPKAEGEEVCGMYNLIKEDGLGMTTAGDLALSLEVALD